MSNLKDPSKYLKDRSNPRVLRLSSRHGNLAKSYCRRRLKCSLLTFGSNLFESFGVGLLCFETCSKIIKTFPVHYFIDKSMLVGRHAVRPGEMMSVIQSAHQMLIEWRVESGQYSNLLALLKPSWVLDPAMIASLAKLIDNILNLPVCKRRTQMLKVPYVKFHQHQIDRQFST